MSESICKFIPSKKENGAIKTVRFVYETECAALSFPHVSPIYFLAVVTRGEGTLFTEDACYPLKRGDVFLILPTTPFSLKGDDIFAYIYITFMGTEVPTRLSRMGIDRLAPYFPDHTALCPTFENAIRSVTAGNACLLTESLLLHTLSLLCINEEEDTPDTDTPFSLILDYIDEHFSDPALSLYRLTVQFSYTEKYLSALFKKNMRIGFSEYLNNLRIQNANLLIERHAGSVTEIAYACGFRDPSYFSRIYKKKTGISPSQMLALVGADHTRAKGDTTEKE